MARLSGAPPPPSAPVQPHEEGTTAAPATTAGESSDILRRRWLKQNRDLAKHNQTQAVKLRALESELAAFRTENLELREQKISLEHRHARSQRHQRTAFVEPVDLLKRQLDSKVHELRDILSGFTAIQDAFSRSPPPSRGSAVRRSGSLSSAAPSPPGLRKWKTSLSLSDVANGLEGHLDPILEDDHTRSALRSGKTQTLTYLRANGGVGPLSPSLLPRPTSPSPNTPSPSPPPARNWLLHGFGSLDAAAELEEAGDPPINFEIRRRRRQSPTEEKREEHLGLMPPADIAESAEERTAAVREDVEMVESKSPVASPASRSPPNKCVAEDKTAGHGKNVKPTKVAVARTTVVAGAADRRRKLPATKAQDENVASSGQKAVAESKPKAKAILPARRASNIRKPLAPKSVNQDLASPAKSTTNQTKDVSKPSVKIADPPVGSPKAAPTRRLSKRSSGLVAPLTIETKPPAASSEPETPNLADPDPFSPTSTESSSRRDTPLDTPPPKGLDPMISTADALTGGRPTRRARQPISYAQPNLRDKMRRPTEQLVDAVVESRPSIGGREGRKSFRASQDGQRRSVSADGVLRLSKGDDKDGEKEARPIDRLYASLKEGEQQDGSPVRARPLKLPSPGASEVPMESEAGDLSIFEFPRSSSPTAPTAKEGRRRTVSALSTGEAGVAKKAVIVPSKVGAAVVALEKAGAKKSDRPKAKILPVSKATEEAKKPGDSVLTRRRSMMI